MEDERIVSLFWDRKEEAIACTKQKYGKLLYSVAYRILHSREDSENCWRERGNTEKGGCPQKDGYPKKEENLGLA